jgi:hypothetical protein
MVAHCEDLICDRRTISTLDATAIAANEVITIGRDGRALIAYTDDGQRALRMARCDDVPCNTATVHVIATGGQAGQHPQITMGDDGRAIVFHKRVSAPGAPSPHLAATHCDDEWCTSATTITVDTDCRIYTADAATVGMDGMPLALYLDENTWDLKMVHCSNDFCVPHFRGH